MTDRKSLIPMLVAVAVLALMTPFEPIHWLISSIDSLSVDAAFVIALPALFQSGAQYGVDAVFTYGPWGFLVNGVVPPEMQPLVIALRACFAAVVALIAASTIGRMRGGLMAQLPMGVCFVGLLSFWAGGVDQGFWFFPSLYLGLYYSIAPHDDRSKLQFLIALAATVAAALAGFVKFNTFVFSAGVQIALLARDLSYRRPPWIFVTWCVSAALAWIAAGQNLANLPLWVASSLDLSAGYSEAMSKGLREPYDRATILYFLGLLLVFLTIAVRSASSADRRRAIGMLAVSLLLAGLAWQHFIGGNQLPQAVGETLAGLWLLIAARLRDAPQRRLPAEHVATGLLAVSFAVATLGTPVLWGVVEGMSAGVARKAEAINDVARGQSSGDPWSKLMESARASIPIRTELSGRADVYPQHTAAVIADPQLRYAPRPAYLSLNAHTVALANANADYLRRSPPDVVLFQVLHPSRAVNNRHPATADGPSWIELITRYDLNGETEEFLILKRRPTPVPFRTSPIATKQVRWGESVSGSFSGKMVWARVRVKPSLLGRLAKVFFKLPHVIFQQTLADGTKSELQIVPALGEAGFLLSPFVPDTAAFARLMQTSIADPIDPSRVVTAFTIVTEPHAKRFWSPDVEIEMVTLDMDPSHIRTTPPLVAGEILLRDLWKNAGACLRSPTLEPVPDVPYGKAYLFHAPCTTSLRIPAMAEGLKVRFGLRYASGPAAPTTDGVSLNLTALGTHKDVIAQASRFLNPAALHADRGEQSLMLNWKAGTVREVRLDFGTGPASDPNGDHSYVSGVEFLMSPGDRIIKPNPYSD